MENKNGQTIFLSVIGIATLLVAIVGATFAYFTTTMDGADGSVTVTTATISDVTFAGSVISTDTNVLPGWESTGNTFSVTASGITGDSTIAYECTAITTNTLGDELDIKVVSTDNGTVEGDYAEYTTLTTSAVKIASGALSSSNAADAYTYDVIFNNNGDQDDYQGQSSTVTVACSLTGDAQFYVE